MAPPAVFMSYPRAADRDQKITRLREKLEAEIELLTGYAGFTIFQDVSMGLGEEERAQRG
jgi:hypothetical protein